jgi:hypothetical protein
VMNMMTELCASCRRLALYNLDGSGELHLYVWVSWHWVVTALKMGGLEIFVGRT